MALPLWKAVSFCSCKRGGMEGDSVGEFVLVASTVGASVIVTSKVLLVLVTTLDAERKAYSLKLRPIFRFEH